MGADSFRQVNSGVTGARRFMRRLRNALLETAQ
jgi:hypothetical protein